LNVISRWINRLPDVIGVGLVISFIFVALCAPLLAPVSNIFQHNSPGDPYYTKQSFKISLFPQAPSSKSLLGTNSGQYDIYYSLVWGARGALTFSVVVSLAAALLGVIVGAISGYLGGWVSNVSMSVTSGFLTVPVIAGFVIVDMVKRILWDRLVGTEFPAGGFYSIHGGSVTSQFLYAIDPLMVSLVLLAWMPYARILNGMVRIIKSSEFVTAARCVGVKDERIIVRHILPNTLPPMLVLIGRDIGSVVLLQAGLTFAGFGGNSVWGNLLWQGMNWVVSGPNIFSYWWVWLPATLTIMLYGIGWNLVGDLLNRRFDPRRYGRI
jgi:peptide/nickel transport system permease protein